MQNEAYTSFFRQLTGYAPFPYQFELSRGAWPEVLDIPTGLGKTAAVIVAWLWKRLGQDAETGRRLVYCLPMRTLVEQTARTAHELVQAAAPLFAEQQKSVPTVHVLMGGSVDEAWETSPDNPAILVGTQDMLLSRALNRGYGMSRYRWPVHFGLLNNDVTWVLDETQLMGVGVETSAQLEGLRQKLGVHGPAHTVWMSATVGSEQLDTVNHRAPNGGWRRQTLDDADRREPTVAKRLQARKPIRRLDTLEPLSKETEKHYPKQLAEALLDAHERRGGLTLAVLNRVQRAQEVYTALERIASDVPLALVHARFRPGDRQKQEAVLHEEGDRIVVATQAVEAGLDVSAATLFTELAPWASLVQRFGRCNRRGEYAEAEIFWIDIVLDQKQSKTMLPYEQAELRRARTALSDLSEAGPQALSQLEVDEPPVPRPVLRQRDLRELFDTTPDLTGTDIDVSRFVRDGMDTDVFFYWRALHDEQPTTDSPAPDRQELCRVPVHQAREFLDRLQKKRTKARRDSNGSSGLTAWQWDALRGEWEPAAERPLPGQFVLLSSDAGGYSPELGWTGAVGGSVEPVILGHAAAQRELGGDLDTEIGRWVELSAHLRHVAEQAQRVVEAQPLDDHLRRAVVTAAAWHDLGKAHCAFQERLLAPVENQPERQPPKEGLWAKSAHRLRHRGSRPHFRHELASALAWMQVRGDDEQPENRDLVGYLIAAHHGKVRLSIRAVAGEAEPEQPGAMFARGIWDGDPLPQVQVPGAGAVGPCTLHLDLMQMGRGSWLERMVALRDTHGPFRLALLEALVRVADWLASERERSEATDD